MEQNALMKVIIDHTNLGSFHLLKIYMAIFLEGNCLKVVIFIIVSTDKSNY